jgi:hypothetical protein
MPIRSKRPAFRHPRADDLLRRLVQEWKQPRDDASEPVIVYEGGTPDRPTHLYVVWSDWGDLNQQERSEIIMEAYEQAKGADAGLHVTVAMGLTPEEAKRMNIDWT